MGEQLVATSDISGRMEKWGVPEIQEILIPTFIFDIIHVIGVNGGLLTRAAASYVR